MAPATATEEPLVTLWTEVPIIVRNLYMAQMVRQLVVQITIVEQPPHRSRL